MTSFLSTKPQLGSKFLAQKEALGTLVFYLLTILIVQGGIKQGIEKWSTRLMPALFVFCAPFVYIMTQQGAVEGLKHYDPDFEKVMDRKLICYDGTGVHSPLVVAQCYLRLYLSK